MIAFVTASHKEDVLEKNLRSSPIFNRAELEVMRDYSNISKAYNQALSKGHADIIVYVHHDVYLPLLFYINLTDSLRKMESIDPDWGVLGVAGVKYLDGKKTFHGFLEDRGKPAGSPANLPIEVDTLDEVLLITKGDFIFDEQIPGTHFYGADICMQARVQGRKNYTINAYVHHNSTLGFGERPPDFEACKEYFRQKYIDHLPIATTCTIVT